MADDRRAASDRRGDAVAKWSQWSEVSGQEQTQMVARRDDDREWNDDFDDDSGDDSDDDVMPCPYCGAEIYEDAVRCPSCEQYLSDTERTTTTQPRWVIVTAAIVLAAFLWAMLRGM